MLHKTGKQRPQNGGWIRRLRIKGSQLMCAHSTDTCALLYQAGSIESNNCERNFTLHYVVTHVFRDEVIPREKTEALALRPPHTARIHQSTTSPGATL